MASISTSDRSGSCLPGLDLPLTYIPNGEIHHQQCFPYVDLEYDISGNSPRSGFVELRYEHPLLTLRELCMLRAMDDVTDKPNWEQKIFDSTISSKWKEELMSVETSGNVGFTEAMADWCIAELRDTAEFYKKTGSTPIFNGLVQKSDIAIPQSLNNRLRAAVSPLENVPSRLQDWHPGSDGKVLDLVHPSLYPLVYGVTRVLEGQVTLKDCIERSGQGIVISRFRTFPDDIVDGFSRDFQWLPCNVEFTKDDKVRIASYINNLHPQKNAELYSVIGDIIACCIPLWNGILTAAVNPKRVRITFDGYPYPRTPDSEDGSLCKERADQYPKPQREEDESSEYFVARCEAWEMLFYPSTQPEPLGTFSPNWREFPNERIGPHWYGNASWSRRMLPSIDEDSNYISVPPVDLRSRFAKDGIQVIVKLANIQLTLEKPEYTGGTWHIEGQMNEHICASAIYYYDSENITDSSLAFRYQCAWNVRFDYPSWVHHWFDDIYGLQPDSSVNQTFGSVNTKQGRLIAFPNILQHQVQPFKLADRTKPGHRKILALFLVDPHIRIISTANVPCQQKEWWCEAFMSGSRDAVSKGLNRLPVELQQAILELVDFPTSQGEAEEFRLELMNERSYLNSIEKGGHNPFEDYHFSLCEH